MSIELFFAGYGFAKSNEFIHSIKSSRLLSYINDRRLIENFFEIMKSNNEHSKLFIDSGAFTAWTKGKEIDVDEYIKFINDNSDYIYLYGQVDDIPGSRSGGEVTRLMIEKSAQNTWENYLYMRPKMKNPKGLLYTFHVGEPIEFLKQALEWKDENGESIPYIALGGMVGKPKSVRDSFLYTCFQTIKQSSNPNVKVHAFGMTDFDLLEKYPITSADSTSWILTGATGMIKSDYGTIIISDFYKNEPEHYTHLTLEAQKKLKETITKFGFDLDTLKDSIENRIKYNALYLKDRVANLVQQPFKIKKKLF